MSGVNKVILVGRLGKDPVLRTTAAGVSVASFSIATSENYKNDKGEKVEKTEWHNLVLWKGLADLAVKYLNKGSQIYVEGKLRNRSYEQEGQTKYITEVHVDAMTFLGGGTKNGASDEAPGTYQQASPQGPAKQHAPYNNAMVSPPVGADADDLPF